MKFRNTPHSGSFDNVVFAWVDILGYKNLVQNASDPNEVLKIVSSVDFSAQATYEIQIERRIISDAIIFWSTDRKSLFPILNLCGLLQTAVIKHGYLVKGYVTYGQHFSQRVTEYDTDTQKVTDAHDEIMISKALIHAYTEESKLKEPIVELDHSVEELIEENKTAYPLFGDMFEQIESRKFIFNYYNTHELNILCHDLRRLPHITGNPADIIAIDKCKDLLLIYKNAIQKGLKLKKGPRKYWSFMHLKHSQFLRSACLKNFSNASVSQELKMLEIDEQSFLNKALTWFKDRFE